MAEGKNIEDEDWVAKVRCGSSCRCGMVLAVLIVQLFLTA